MSLTSPPKRKPNTQQKKRIANHHRKGKSYQKPYWPYLPLLVIVLVAVAFNTLWMQRGVLDYAVDTSPASLLTSANKDRSNHKLGALAINRELSQAAQTKANDMVTRNYWSHVTPDGQQPWTFINEAGYSYQTAGENLAFGFATSHDTEVGWMNSPGHRANILNTTYTQVGFGIANSANFDSHGHQTVVVAMYASPIGSPAAPAASAPVKTKQSTPPANNPASVTPAQPTSPKVPSKTTPITPAPPTSSPTGSDTVTAAGTKPTEVLAGEAQPVSRIQLLSGTIAPWSSAALAVIVILLGAIYVSKHGLAWKKVLINGERFVNKHKILDTLIVVVIVGGIVMLQTVGFTQ